MLDEIWAISCHTAGIVGSEGVSMLAVRIVGLAVVLSGATALFAQDPAPQNPAPQNPPPEHVHDMEHMDMSADGVSDKRWHLMQDGSLYLLLNRQGGPRGDTEFVSPNWWMGMMSGRAGRGTLTLMGMFSLDAATVGRRGYGELFQVGEALDGRPITDRQHPHDALMQLSAAWRTPIGNGRTLTLAGGPSGEPALGPIAFMHRLSAAAVPFAPLGHHTFDSTHVAFGVATVGLTRGQFTAEASVFNGREPDEVRWDFDFRRMDSVSGRLWYRPAPGWDLQVSTGHLVEPEQLGHGDVVRTTASASYSDSRSSHVRALAIGVGMNRTDDVVRHAVFAEGTRNVGASLISVRGEVVEVESELLVTGEVPHTHAGEARKAATGALTLAIARPLGGLRGVVMDLVGSATTYAVPSALRATHGARPFSFQIGVQVRPRPGSMGRMWNMRMGGTPMGMAQ